jgi:hypothetical protein
MKYFYLGLVLSLIFISTSVLHGQSDKSGASSMKGVSLSLNPLGFVQFGPVVNAEVGLNDHVVLNGHIRFASLGLLSKVVLYDEDDDIFPDNVSGSGIGGGILYFFGEKKNKPYLGGLFELHNTVSIYDTDAMYEWESESNMIVLFVNGGYRFRFDSGFFINTGAYLGAAVGEEKWYYTNPAVTEYGTTNTEPSTFPFGMLELAFGMQF